jgi:class 3 adenylate cyclase
MDDKGLVIVVGFGLQPLVVTCPAACACLAALQMQQSRYVSDKGVLRIGIGTGPVFCAAIGSDFRREFALVGKVVNLAARLAFFSLKAMNDGDTNVFHSICVDEETERSARGR